MKSPLVEALRQATDKAANEPQAAEPPVEDQLATSSAEPTAPPPDESELSLMESTAVLAVDAAANLDEQEATADIPEMESSEEIDAAFEDMATPQPADAVLASAMTNRPSRMPRIGLYSPLLCLALVCASGMLHFFVQRLGGTYENADLASVPAQSRSATQTSGSVDSAGTPGRFQLVVGPQSRPTGSRDRRDPEPAARNTIDERRPPGTAASTVSLAPAAPGLQDRAYETLVAAHSAYRNGEYTVAESHYRQALELAPRHPNALHGLAAILERTGRQAESLQHYKTLLSVDPGNTAAAAAVLAASNNDATDIKHLIREHPDSPQLRFALGAVFAAQSRWPEARLAFDAASRLDPGNADYLFNLAVTLEHLGNYLDARHYYESALAAADATSSLDSAIVIARIDELAVLADNGSVVP